MMQRKTTAPPRAAGGPSRSQPVQNTSSTTPASSALPTKQASSSNGESRPLPQPRSKVSGASQHAAANCTTSVNTVNPLHLPSQPTVKVISCDSSTTIPSPMLPASFPVTPPRSLNAGSIVQNHHRNSQQQRDKPPAPSRPPPQHAQGGSDVEEMTAMPVRPSSASKASGALRRGVGGGGTPRVLLFASPSSGDGGGGGGATGGSSGAANVAAAPAPPRAVSLPVIINVNKTTSTTTTTSSLMGSAGVSLGAAGNGGPGMSSSSFAYSASNYELDLPLPPPLKPAAATAAAASALVESKEKEAVEKKGNRDAANGGTKSSAAAAAAATVEEEEEEDRNDLANSEMLAVDKFGRFVAPDLMERYSLRDLYAARCAQLHLKRPNQSVESQLPTRVGEDAVDTVVGLDCKDTYLGEKGSLALASVIPLCQSLRFLLLRGVGLSGRSPALQSILMSLRSCENLTLLDLSDNPLDDGVERWVSALRDACPSLTTIRLDRTGLSPSILRRLTQRVRSARPSSFLATASSAADSTAVKGGVGERESSTRESFSSATAAGGGEGDSTPVSHSSFVRAGPLAYSPARSVGTVDTGSYFTNDEELNGALNDASSEAGPLAVEALSEVQKADLKLRTTRYGNSRRGSSSVAGSSSGGGGSGAKHPRHHQRPRRGRPVHASGDDTGRGRGDEVHNDSRETDTYDGEEEGDVTDEETAQVELHDAEERLREARRRVPIDVATALTDLHRRLYRNRHCLQRLYACFLLSEKLERTLCMGRSAPLSQGEAQRSEETWVLRYMELLDYGEADEGANQHVAVSAQQGVCSWKAFFRAMQLLGVQGASRDLPQAVSFASCCGVLTADTVQFGKLLNLLRPHAVLACSDDSELNFTAGDVLAFYVQETERALFASPQHTMTLTAAAYEPEPPDPTITEVLDWTMEPSRSPRSFNSPSPRASPGLHAVRGQTSPVMTTTTAAAAAAAAGGASLGAGGTSNHQHSRAPLNAEHPTSVLSATVTPSDAEKRKAMAFAAPAPILATPSTKAAQSSEGVLQHQQQKQQQQQPHMSTPNRPPQSTTTEHGDGSVSRSVGLGSPPTAGKRRSVTKNSSAVASLLEAGKRGGSKEKSGAGDSAHDGGTDRREAEDAEDTLPTLAEVQYVMDRLYDARRALRRRLRDVARPSPLSPRAGASTSAVAAAVVTTTTKEEGVGPRRPRAEGGVAPSHSSCPLNEAPPPPAPQPLPLLQSEEHVPPTGSRSLVHDLPPLRHPSRTRSEKKKKSSTGSKSNGETKNATLSDLSITPIATCTWPGGTSTLTSLFRDSSTTDPPSPSSPKSNTSPGTTPRMDVDRRGILQASCFTECDTTVPYAQAVEQCCRVVGPDRRRVVRIVLTCAGCREGETVSPNGFLRRLRLPPFGKPRFPAEEETEAWHALSIAQLQKAMQLL